MKPLSTIAKRQAMAKHVGTIASQVLGTPVVLGESDLHPGEFDYRREDFETARGQVRHLHIDVCPRGVNVHIKFNSRLFSPSRRPKWNHYIWPHGDATPLAYRYRVSQELEMILKEVIPNGRTRQDRPDMAAWWEVQRAEFAAVCAAREAKEVAA